MRSPPGGAEPKCCDVTSALTPKVDSLAHLLVLPSDGAAGVQGQPLLQSAKGLAGAAAAAGRVSAAAAATGGRRPLAAPRGRCSRPPRQHSPLEQSPRTEQSTLPPIP